MHSFVIYFDGIKLLWNNHFGQTFIMHPIIFKSWCWEVCVCACVQNEFMHKSLSSLWPVTLPSRFTSQTQNFFFFFCSNMPYLVIFFWQNPVYVQWRFKVETNLLSLTAVCQMVLRAAINSYGRATIMKRGRSVMGAWSALLLCLHIYWHFYKIGALMWLDPGFWQYRNAPYCKRLFSSKYKVNRKFKC